MTDREMLELAARAAWYVVESHHVSGGAWVRPVGEMPDADGDYPGLFLWRPREDDGDALRLAVYLEFEIDITSTGVAVRTKCGLKVLVNKTEEPDLCAAARLAITRAATEIGRQIKETSNG